MSSTNGIDVDTINVDAIGVDTLIARIEKRQPVLNKTELTAVLRQKTVAGVGGLDVATSEQLAFLSNAKYVKALAQTQAAVVLIPEDQQENVPADSVALVVAAPYLAYASCSQLFAAAKPKAGIHPTAVVAETAVIGEGVSIGAFAVIGEAVRIGADSCIDSHVSIGEGSTIGERCVIKAHVCIAEDCQIGDEVRIHAQSSIGSEGFGFAPTADPASSGWERIAQLGRVIIGNQVRIGSQTCIDRGAVGDTVIADHVIIDNLVQIAHNVQIGAGTAIAANTGIAGSTKIGKRCIIGGAVGINGHLEIADDVTFTGMSMVTKSIKESGSYSSGVPAMPTQKWRKAAVRFRKVD